MPAPDGEETFILCRSRDRREKEKAMHGRFERRIEEGLQKIEAGCRRQRLPAVTVAQRVGRLLGKNSRAAGLFQTEVKTAADGRALWNGTRTTLGAIGPPRAKAATCCGATSTIGATRTFGRRTSN